MINVQTIVTLMDEFAPGHLAEDWDNVGLLVGDRQRPVRRIMTCLTITPQTAAEAIGHQSDLIVSHHPLPFRTFKRLTSDTTAGRLLLDLIGAGIAIISPHTAFDSARNGINQTLADGIGLTDITPVVTIDDSSGADSLGTGRWGRVVERLTLAELAERVKHFLAISQLRVVGADDLAVSRVAVACGSGGSLLESVRRLGCDCLVTGETSFHTCLEADAHGLPLILSGHYASERFAVERLADHLAGQLDGLEVWASRAERDPIRWT